MPLVLLLAASLSACDDGKSASPPTAAPEQAAPPSASVEGTRVESTVISPPKDAPSAAAAPPAEAPSAAPAVEKGTSALAASPTTQAADTGAPASSAKAEAAAGKPASSGAPVSAKKAAPGSSVFAQAKNGILPPGAADKIFAAGARVAVKLTSPGAEPREALAYALTTGSKPQLDMNMDMVMSLQMGDQALPPTALPRMVMGLDILVGERGPDKSWKIDAALERVGLQAKGPQQEAMASQMRAPMDKLKGLQLGYFISPTGHVRDIKIRMPAGFPQQAEQLLSGMNQSFEAMVTPLPEEPVGVGATWEVVTRVSSSGADLVQLATYTLKARAGTKATLDVTVKQVAAKATINPPGLPAGTTARMISFHSNGGGLSQIDTTSVAPVSGRMDVKSGMQLEVGDASAKAERTTVETTLMVEYARPAK